MIDSNISCDRLHAAAVALQRAFRTIFHGESARSWVWEFQNSDGQFETKVSIIWEFTLQEDMWVAFGEMTVEGADGHPAVRPYRVGHEVPSRHRGWGFFGSEETSRELDAMLRQVSALRDLRPILLECVLFASDIRKRAVDASLEETRFAHVIGLIEHASWLDPYQPHLEHFGTPAGCEWVAQELRVTHRAYVNPPPLDALAELVENLARLFSLTDLQKAVLEALDSVALRLDDLERRSGYLRGPMYRKGGIKELVKLGLVENDRRIGFFRPDRPPPGIK